MRILLDDSLPAELAQTLRNFDVSTVWSERWNRLGNSTLLRVAADARYKVFITSDASIPFQQDVTRFGIAVIVVIAPTSRFDDVRPFVPLIVEAILRIKPGNVISIGPIRRPEQIRDAAAPVLRRRSSAPPG